MKEFYNSNASFKRFVDRHCKQYECTVEQALEHAMVREVYNYYRYQAK